MTNCRNQQSVEWTPPNPWDENTQFRASQTSRSKFRGIRTNSFREQIQVLKYENEEYYKWHSDQAADRNDNAYYRTISVVLYLTDDFEGGRTEFPHTSYKPKAGQALIFPSNWCFPHQSTPVTKGTKIVAVTWYSCFYNYD